ncbi:MAG: cation:proton antiporter [Nostoc sp.]
MEESLPITILISATVVAGIAAQVLAGYFHIPSIVLLLLFGILLGRDGFDFLDPSLLGIGLEVVVSLSVALILFEGGLNLQLGELKEVSNELKLLLDKLLNKGELVIKWYRKRKNKGNSDYVAI